MRGLKFVSGPGYSYMMGTASTAERESIAVHAEAGDDGVAFQVGDAELLLTKDDLLDLLVLAHEGGK